MILTLLLALPLCAQTQPPTSAAEPAAKPESQEWWEQLSPEEQKEMRARLEKMRKMPKEQREEIKRRKQVFEKEKDAILKSMSTEQRAAYDALGERDQKRLLRRQVHENLRARGADLREHHPEMGHGRAGFVKMREKQVLEGLAKAAEDGWIGDRAVRWLEKAPLHEQMAVLMEVRKWEVLESAALRGLWEEYGLDEHEQIRISNLPAPEFFHELRVLSGDAAPGERPGEGFGPGRGPGNHPGGRRGGRGGFGPGRNGQGPGGPPREGPGGPPRQEERPKRPR